MNGRLFIVLTLAILASFSILDIESAWARAGSGSSTGSRGSRSTVAPAKPAPTTPRPADPSPVVSPSPMSPRPSPFGGFMGALGGFMLGGLLGGLVFGGLGHGFGGIGRLDLRLIGGAIASVVMWTRRARPTPEPAYSAVSGGPDTA